MHQIDVRNVNEALPLGISYLQRHGAWEDTRAGRALVAPGPVATVYSHPRERVMFSALRDANPFFHVGEALWMLAGRRDVAFLNNFVRDFGARFAEPDGTIHDAYGYRWRHAFGFDQLDAVVSQLSVTPGSRQAVISMWDPTVDTATGGEEDLTGSWKTRPCNTHAYLRIRNTDWSGIPADVAAPMETVLDITVCCRSNDVVFGAYGANVTQFSILQEYLAARLDVGVGTYTQFSNNYHIYEDQMKKLSVSSVTGHRVRLWDDRYSSVQDLVPQPLVHDVESFDDEVQALLGEYEKLHSRGRNNYTIEEFHNPFLHDTVWPMLMSHRAWKDKAYDDALSWCCAIAAPDWRAAATEWIERRIK
jgi:thymidylate synthase